MALVVASTLFVFANFAYTQQMNVQKYEKFIISESVSFDLSISSLIEFQKCACGRSVAQNCDESKLGEIVKMEIAKVESKRFSTSVRSQHIRLASDYIIRRDIVSHVLKMLAWNKKAEFIDIFDNTPRMLQLCEVNISEFALEYISADSEKLSKSAL